MAEVAVQVGVGAQALAIVERVRTRFTALPPRRRNWLLAALAMILAVTLGLGWYAGRPDWRVLFSGLEAKDVQQVSQELAAAGIPFQAASDGAGVEVPADQLEKARMEVAAKGMPQTGRLGFELFDKPNWVGSEFDERVNYQRALEGELEHTIATLGVVRSARVHLVLPQASLFTAEEKVAKASVVLKLKRSSLSPEQTDSIRNLVAGAVENLAPEQVTLVDADGRANLAIHGGGPAADDAEHLLESRLVAMLEPLAGAGNVRATVNVQYSEASEDRTDEVYDPSQTGTLSMQKSEQVAAGSAHGPAQAQGIPGTASNTPAAAPVGAAQGSAQAAAPGAPPLLAQTSPVYPGGPGGAGGGQTSREENGTYAVTRHIVHTLEGPGRIRRVTAAVVVNDRSVSEVMGKLEKTTWKPRTSEEMHRLEGLAQAAIGYDEKRGDQVVLENVSFSSNVPEGKATGLDRVLEQAKALVGAQPGLLKTTMLGGLGLLVVLFVLRPVASQVVATLREPMLLSPGSVEVEQVREIAGTQSAVASDVRIALDREGQTEAVSRVEVARKQKLHAGQAVFDQVTEHIRREPLESTRLIEAWIGAAGESTEPQDNSRKEG